MCLKEAQTKRLVLDYNSEFCVCLQLSHGILLGVVGSDIPLMEVMKLAPRYMVSSGRFTLFLLYFISKINALNIFCSPLSWELTATPSSSTTTATSCLTPTFDLW